MPSDLDVAVKKLEMREAGLEKDIQRLFSQTLRLNETNSTEASDCPAKVTEIPRTRNPVGIALGGRLRGL